MTIKRAIAGALMFGAVAGMLVLDMTTVSVQELEARGRGGPGQGRGGQSAGRRGTRGRAGGVGRIGRNSFGMGRFKGGNTSAKEWQAIQDQEDRIKLIKERRDTLMDEDRVREQEKLLENERGNAAIAATLDAAIR